MEKDVRFFAQNLSYLGMVTFLCLPVSYAGAKHATDLSGSAINSTEEFLFEKSVNVVFELFRSGQSPDLENIYRTLDEQQVTENSIVIFDVDGTAIPGTCHVDQPKPLMPALDLYNYFKKRGVKLYFMTARENSIESLHYTKIQLNNAGYSDFVKIIGMPRNKKKEATKENWASERNLNAVWKEAERTNLAKKFNIVATVDDRVENLNGRFTGLKIWVKSHRPHGRRAHRRVIDQSDGYCGTTCH